MRRAREIITQCLYVILPIFPITICMKHMYCGHIFWEMAHYTGDFGGLRWAFWRIRAESLSALDPCTIGCRAGCRTRNHARFHARDATGRDVFRTPVRPSSLCARHTSAHLTRAYTSPVCTRQLSRLYSPTRRVGPSKRTSCPTGAWARWAQSMRSHTAHPIPILSCLGFRPASRWSI